MAAVGSGLGAGGLAWSFATPTAFGRTEVSSSQQRWLLAILPRIDKRYDPLARMLVTSATGGLRDYGASKSGDVHATRDSLNYAAALLDTGVDWRIRRATEILRAGFALQDQDPESKTYGLWPCCLEEPIAGLATPDWSCGDFCGVPLVRAESTVRLLLPASTEESPSSTSLLTCPVYACAPQLRLGIRAVEKDDDWSGR